LNQELSLQAPTGAISRRTVSLEILPASALHRMAASSRIWMRMDWKGIPDDFTTWHPLEVVSGLYARTAFRKQELAAG
jgi:hypothetical protein